VELLEQAIPAGPGVPGPGVLVPEVDERAARRSLREQTAKLERELGNAVCAAYPRIACEPVGVRHAGPRLLGLGELEALRDDLAARMRELRASSAVVAERQEAKRLLIERMLLAPGEHKWVRVSNEDIGQPGCKNWHVRPRLGLIGMLAGWWHVKISSGCPLPEGSRCSP